MTDASIYKTEVFAKSQNTIQQLQAKSIMTTCSSSLYNEFEKELCYREWLIVDRLTRVRLISLTEVGSSAQSFLEEQTIDHKKQRFQNLCELKSTNLKALKGELLFNYKKNFRLKSLNTRFFLRTILQEHKSQFSSYIIYHYFRPGIFMFGIYSLSNSLPEKLI